MLLSTIPFEPYPTKISNLKFQSVIFGIYGPVETFSLAARALGLRRRGRMEEAAVVLEVQLAVVEQQQREAAAARAAHGPARGGAPCWHRGGGKSTNDYHAEQINSQKSLAARATSQAGGRRVLWQRCSSCASRTSLRHLKKLEPEAAVDV